MTADANEPRVRILVRFRAGGIDYAVALRNVLRVEEASRLGPLPDPLPEVAGLLTQPEGTITVLESLGAGGPQVLVLDCEEGRFGLRVDAVSGVERVEEDALAPAPPGQRGGLVAGLVGEALLIDANALAGRLRSGAGASR